jgi:hypothetical protein
VKAAEFKPSVFGNLVPFLKQFLPAVYRGHTEGSGGNLRPAVGSTIINVNDLRVGHGKITISPDNTLAPLIHSRIVHLSPKFRQICLTIVTVFGKEK